MSAFSFPRRTRRTLFAQGEWETAENRGGGAGGIRTHDRLLTYTHFPGERLRPLGHRSAFCSGRGALIARRGFRKPIGRGRHRP